MRFEWQNYSYAFIHDWRTWQKFVGPSNNVKWDWTIEAELLGPGIIILLTDLFAFVFRKFFFPDYTYWCSFSVSWLKRCWSFKVWQSSEPIEWIHFGENIAPVTLRNGVKGEVGMRNGMQWIDKSSPIAFPWNHLIVFEWESIWKEMNNKDETGRTSWDYLVAIRFRTWFAIRIFESRLGEEHNTKDGCSNP